MDIEYAAITCKGNIRKENQDSIFFDGKAICGEDNFNTDGFVFSSEKIRFAVFDGVGGENCGGEASAIAAKKLVGSDSEQSGEICLKINREICKYMKENGIRTMGTTAAILTLKSDRTVICNIGDSRIYRLRNEQMEKLSTDHVVSLGRNARRVLTQYLGIDEEEMVIEPSEKFETAQTDDLYLICSDGLTDMVDEREIEDTIKENQVSEAAKQLLEKALQNGGKDNTSLIICKIISEV